MPSPSIYIYALSAAAQPALLSPQHRGTALHLPASAESILVVISGGAPHSWKIYTGGDALISGTYHSCPFRDSVAAGVACSALDAVAVLPLPVGLGRILPIAFHVSVEVDYSGSAGLADFGVADDDEEDDIVNRTVQHNSQSAASAGLQFERSGKGPASALQVCVMHVLRTRRSISSKCFCRAFDPLLTTCTSGPRVLCGSVATLAVLSIVSVSLRASFSLAGLLASAEFYFAAFFIRSF